MNWLEEAKEAVTDLGKDRSWDFSDDFLHEAEHQAAELLPKTLNWIERAVKTLEQTQEYFGAHSGACPESNCGCLGCQVMELLGELKEKK